MGGSKRKTAKLFDWIFIEEIRNNFKKYSIIYALVQPKRRPNHIFIIFVASQARKS